MEKCFYMTYHINGTKQIIDELKEKLKTTFSGKMLISNLINTNSENHISPVGTDIVIINDDKPLYDDNNSEILVAFEDKTINIENIFNDDSFKNQLTISYEKIDEENNIFQIHNGNTRNIFHNECCVISYGEPFETKSCHFSIKTIKNAVEEWFVKMNANINNLKQGYNEATQNNGSEPDFYQYMMELINNFDYQKHEIKPHYKINLFEYI